MSWRHGRVGKNVELSTREALILAAMCGFAAFNLHNADMKTVIHVFTLVPAIMFTFRIIAINNDNSTISVTAVAMFWMYYGMGLICDVLIGGNDSYAAVQLVLVGALGVTAYRGTPMADRSDSDDFRTILSGSYTLLQQTQSPKDSRAKESRRLSLKSRPESMPTARGCSIRSPMVQGTQCSTSALSTMTAHNFTDDLVENTLLTAVLSDTETALEIFPMHSSKHRSTAAWLSECRKNRFLDDVNEGMVVIDYGGLLTSPRKTIRFDSPTETKILTVTNIVGQNLTWTIKTNAVYEIRAQPTQGTLSRGETIIIKVTLNGGSIILPDTDHSNDKVFFRMCSATSEK
ncbi:Major sperm protein [Trichostrongylus colubriformis]|uniref:Major sperm protein n=1 Tax=Trichostrongylus colubriformis TaxID=6319 RepID=A0AAN8FGI3_TRICO